MATVSAIILQADPKGDGTYNVKIRVWHNGKPAYIDTVHFVGKNQVKPKSKGSKTLVIKDDFVKDRVGKGNLIFSKYRAALAGNKDFRFLLRNIYD